MVISWFFYSWPWIILGNVCTSCTVVIVVRQMNQHFWLSAANCLCCYTIGMRWLEENSRHFWFQISLKLCLVLLFQSVAFKEVSSVSGKVWVSFCIKKNMAEGHDIDPPSGLRVKWGHTPYLIEQCWGKGGRPVSLSRRFWKKTTIQNSVAFMPNTHCLMGNSGQDSHITHINRLHLFSTWFNDETLQSLQGYFCLMPRPPSVFIAPLFPPFIFMFCPGVLCVLCIFCLHVLDSAHFGFVCFLLDSGFPCYLIHIRKKNPLCLWCLHSVPKWVSGSGLDMF